MLRLLALAALVQQSPAAPQELAPGTHRIAARDVIEVGSIRYEVITATS